MAGLAPHGSISILKAMQMMVELKTMLVVLLLLLTWVSASSQNEDYLLVRSEDQMPILKRAATELSKRRAKPIPRSGQAMCKLCLLMSFTHCDPLIFCSSRPPYLKA